MDAFVQEYCGLRLWELVFILALVGFVGLLLARARRRIWLCVRCGSKVSSNLPLEFEWHPHCPNCGDAMKLKEG